MNPHSMLKKKKPVSPLIVPVSIFLLSFFCNAPKREQDPQTHASPVRQSIDIAEARAQLKATKALCEGRTVREGVSKSYPHSSQKGRRIASEFVLCHLRSPLLPVPAPVFQQFARKRVKTILFFDARGGKFTTDYFVPDNRF
jgi:hypothetical protein